MRKILLILLAAALIIAFCAIPAADAEAPETPELPNDTEVEEKMNKEETAAAQKAVISFESFDGGGPEFDVLIEDPDIADCETTRSYYKDDHDQMTGSGYAVIMTFTGKKPGKTAVTVEARSPIADNFDASYELTVDEDLNASIELISTTDLCF